MYKPNKVEIFLPDGTRLFSSEDKPPAKNAYAYPPPVSGVVGLKRTAKDGDDYDGLVGFLIAGKEKDDER